MIRPPRVVLVDENSGAEPSASSSSPSGGKMKQSGSAGAFRSPSSPRSASSCADETASLLAVDGRRSSASPQRGSSMFLLGSAEQQQLEDERRSVAHYELTTGGSPLTAERSADALRGSLTFALRYDFIHRVLMLHVIRAQQLRRREHEKSSHSYDPYIKLYLLPERRTHCRTKICPRTRDPNFNEMFSFDAPYHVLANCMLQFTVYDFERFTIHGLIGNVIMRDLFEKSNLFAWTEYTMPIVGSQGEDDYGDLLLYTSYSEEQEKLYITVAKAYNLRPMDITGASDPYVRCELVQGWKRVKGRRTTTKKANLNPVYHEVLVFDLAVSQIADTNILVQVMDWDRIGSDDLLGCCVLGNDSPTEEGRTQWRSCFVHPATSADDDDDEGEDGGGGGGGGSGGGGDEDENAEKRRTRRPVVGQWHSILAEIPEQFRKLPKARNKTKKCSIGSGSNKH